MLTGLVAPFSQGRFLGWGTHRTNWAQPQHGSLKPLVLHTRMGQFLRHVHIPESPLRPSFSSGSWAPFHNLPAHWARCQGRVWPYPRTVISTDSDPLVLRHGIGCWPRLGSGSRDQRGCRRHGRTDAWRALPVLLCWHLQGQRLRPDHLETLLSKSQGHRTGETSVVNRESLRRQETPLPSVTGGLGRCSVMKHLLYMRTWVWSPSIPIRAGQYCGHQ